MESQVKQSASAIGQCYQVQPDYETIAPGDDAIAFVDLPNSVSIYINGAAGTVAMSIGANDMTRGFDNGSGGATGAGSQGDQAPARSSPTTDPLKDDVLLAPPPSNSASRSPALG